jgi:hypothetical protein
MQPTYPRPPIGSLDTLAKVLGVSKARLTDIAYKPGLYRSAGSRPKGDGKSRELWEAREPLKTLQGRITSRILRVVAYPEYLQGALGERDYVSNATLHAGKKTVVSLDIASFYPTCSIDLIRSVWQHFFKFPPEVAEILTLLTSRNGELPQGASPSSYIGNLVFWDIEHELVPMVGARGMTYSRFVDDITVSSVHPMSGEEKTLVVRSVMNLMRRRGFEVKRGKIQVADRAGNMKVHGLNVKHRRPTLVSRQRDRIRASVKRLEEIASESRSGRAYRKLYLSTMGQVGLLKRFHPVEAEPLMERVKAMYPVPNDWEVTQLRRRTSALCRAGRSARTAPSFLRHLARAFQEISELSKSRPGEARRLGARLRKTGLRR